MTSRRLLALLPILALPACDTFYHLDAEVTDCMTGLPLGDAHAALRVEHPISDPGPLVAEFTSTSDGSVRSMVNQPDTVTATFTLTKAGYHPWTTEFKGTPREQPLRVCLVPCTPAWTRIPGTFSFEKFNEWHTARAFALGCGADVAALSDTERRNLMAFFREAAGEQETVWPFRACGKQLGVASLAPRARQRLGRAIFTDLCFEVTADVP